MGKSNEFDLIRRIREKAGPLAPPLVVGPGDDAAVIAIPAGRDLVFTTDTLAEGVHWRRKWFSAPDLGSKCVVQSLSDLAAMGSEPLAFCAALSMPRGTPDRWVDGFMDGLMEASRRWKCALAGGNISRSPGRAVSVTVSMLGTAAPGRSLLRSAAAEGHAVYLTGWPGLAAAGLADLEADPASKGPHVDRFKRPEPCIDEAAFLMDRLGATAAIDTSDGVWRSLALIAEESGVRVAAHAGALPIHPAIAAAARRRGADPIQWALYGGEDFELVVCAPACAGAAAEFEDRFGRPLTAIGEIRGGSGLEIEGAPPGADFGHF